jgi:hypothetical protein
MNFVTATSDLLAKSTCVVHRVHLKVRVVYRENAASVTGFLIASFSFLWWTGGKSLVAHLTHDRSQIGPELIPAKS